MKKIILSLLVMALLPLTLWADALRDTVPSNYGGWVNLTDGYTQDKDNNNPKTDVIIDGNTIHLCWMELTKVESMRKIWYRRSTDLGKTWEDARVIMEVWEPYSDMNHGLTKVMSVSDGKVHIAAVHSTPDKWGDNRVYATSRVWYMRSDDGGQTFGEKKELGHIIYEGARWYTSLLKSDGNTVVISTWTWAGAGNYDLKLFYSTDAGDTFSELKHSFASGSERGILDLQVSGTRFAVMYHTGDSYSGLIEGNLMVLCCDGSNMHVENIAPICTKQSGNQAHYACPNVMTGYNGNSFDYHPQMVLDGETVQVMYRGNPGLKVLEPGGLDYAYTLYQRSDDFGQTWTTPTVLPDATGGAGTIAAKGDNVYIVTSYKGLQTVYHSHDRGATFEPVTQTVFPDGRYDPWLVFHLAIDPTDETGEHVYFSGNRMFYVESHDGFRTISRNFCLGTESFIGTYYGNNYGLKVFAAQDGSEHWFMQLAKPTIEPNIYGGYSTVEGSRDIMFRRVLPEPAPGAEDMGLNLADSLQPHHRVVVPMSPSLQLRQAITVECWVQSGNTDGFCLASCTTSVTQDASEYNGGWFIRKENNYWNNQQFCFDGCICTDAEENNRVLITNLYPTITLYPGQDWHHVVMTYDDNIAENNACFYVDGELAASNTIHGNLLIGCNPISLGRTSIYGVSHGLLDNFAIWSRALTPEEIQAHYNDPKAVNGKDDDCRLLLTFDGTLQDQSQYGNDAVALMDANLVAHEEIDGITSPMIDIRPTSDDIYSINGLKWDSNSKLPKGIYIKDGKKIIVK